MIESFFISLAVLAIKLWVDVVLGDVMPTESARCPNNMFRCESGDQCISMYAVCDGYRDCYDNSDEADYCNTGM